MLGHRLKKLREERGLLQKDVAKILNISTSAYGYYEQNKRDPDTTTLQILARFFNVSTDYLLGLSDIRNPYKKTSNKTTNNKNDSYNIDDLSPESKKELEKFIQLLKLKDEMDKTKDETSSALEKNA